MTRARPIIGLFAMAATAASGAPALAQQLAGVADEETTIAYPGTGTIRDFQQGRGDVIFVRDRTDRWYRIALNQGCLSGGGFDAHPAARFDTRGGLRIDRLTRVVFAEPTTICQIDSIRRSAPPPQVDSRSPVTGD